MIKEGWQLFQPRMVCDYFGIKDGKLWFVEFKKDENSTFNQLQQMAKDTFPYKVVFYPQEASKPVATKAGSP